MSDQPKSSQNPARDSVNESEARDPLVAAEPEAVAPRQQPASRLPIWAPPLFYLAMSLCFLWRSFFTGEVFLPAHLLEHVAPYAAHAASGTLPPWNPLRWDGIAQFYPWRHFAAETVRTGTIPLWNPYQFSGTPFVANSQSAVFYPGNILFYLLPTATAFGFTALLHLTLCGWFTFLLLQRLRCSDVSALLGGVVFTFSAWQVSWLQLPTFLATSCWFPLLLRQILLLAPASPPHRALARCSGLAAIIGVMLLAGHLQIAFYGLLAGTLCALALLFKSIKNHSTARTASALLHYVVGLTVGFMVASPQLLPAVELSRMSHRVSTPTAAGYQAYVEYALPSHTLITLSLPEFFGGDNDPQYPYWNFYGKHLPDGSVIAVRHNAAETALYVGFLPLLLGGLAIARLATRAARPDRTVDVDFRIAYFAGLAVLALLLSLGTPLNALFYFGIPGFGQSGSPARSLVLWAFASSILAAIGLDSCLKRPPSSREFAAILLIAAFTVAISLSLAASAVAWTMPGLKTPTLGDAFSHLPLAPVRLLLATAIGIFLLRPSPNSAKQQTARSRLPFAATGGLAVLTVALELFSAGMNSNPTASLASVYPVTPGISYLRQHVGHDRIFPVNQRWSLYNSPPAVLPPNAAMVYGIRDVQGYDSLFTGQYKAWANRFARPNRLGQLDASPPEVGNMVFFQNPNTPLVPQTGATFAVTPSPSSPAFVADAAPSVAPDYDAEGEMAIYRLPGAQSRAILLSNTTVPQGIIWGEDDPTRLDLATITQKPANLILADQYYPGWKAILDGRNTPITRPLNAPVYRSVAIPPGQHHLMFRYEPASFRFGLFLACIALSCISFGITFQLASARAKS